MSESSPYTFHVVGTEGEPLHYELRDLSGRVVCKALRGELEVCLFIGGHVETFARLRGYSVEELEARMREMVRG